MFVKTFPVGSFQCNCTIIGDTDTGDAIVVDPGDEAPRILAELQKNNFKVKYIVHTHAHLDHIGATRALKDATGGTIGLHKEDLFLYENIQMQSEMLGMQLDPVVRPVDHYLVHGDVLEWGKNRKLEVMHTPGHTPGSLCFHTDADGSPLVMAGDTLFMGSIGRTDLWGGDYGQIMDSLQTRLMKLDAGATVICGHGPNTTIGREIKSNPFLQN